MDKCGECGTSATVFMTFVGTNVFDYPVCDTCLATAKKRWIGAQVSIRPVDCDFCTMESKRKSWFKRIKEFFFPCKMRRIVNRLIEGGKIRPRKEWGLDG